MWIQRRRFLAAGAGVSAALLAGCAAADEFGADDSSLADGSPGEMNLDGSTGTFRLLISDQPNAIDDFSELNVTFGAARLYRGEGAGHDTDDVDDGSGDDTDDVDDGPDGDADDVDDGPNDDADDVDDGLNDDADDDAGDTDNPDDGAGAAGSTDETEAEEESNDDPGEGSRGWVEIDLDGATVDLTTVVGDVAVPVSETELPEGRYSTIQLDVEAIEGFAAEDGDGGDQEEPEDEAADADDDDEEASDDATDEDVDRSREELSVTVPSNRLRIVRPFEVVADEELTFVFDINVVRRGLSGDYHLSPVIGKSGVVGEDVDVEERSGPDDGERRRDDNERGGSPDDRGRPDDAGPATGGRDDR